MYRVDNSSSQQVLPTPQAVGPNPNSYYANSTVVEPDHLNAMQEELATLIEAMGIALSKTDRTQLLAAIFNTAHNWIDNQHISEKTLSYTANLTWNLNLAQNAVITLTGDMTIDAISNPKPGAVYVLRPVQDSTGGWTITWPANVHWQSGSAPILTTTPGYIDLVTMYYTGTIFLASASFNFAP